VRLRSARRTPLPTRSSRERSRGESAAREASDPARVGRIHDRRSARHRRVFPSAQLLRLKIERSRTLSVSAPARPSDEPPQPANAIPSDTQAARDPTKRNISATQSSPLLYRTCRSFGEVRRTSSGEGLAVRRGRQGTNNPGKVSVCDEAVPRIIQSRGSTPSRERRLLGGGPAPRPREGERSGLSENSHVPAQRRVRGAYRSRKETEM
jgi:hypothetical protein